MEALACCSDKAQAEDKVLELAQALACGSDKVQA